MRSLPSGADSVSCFMSRLIVLTKPGKRRFGRANTFGSQNSFVDAIFADDLFALIDASFDRDFEPSSVLLAANLPPTRFLTDRRDERLSLNTNRTRNVFFFDQNLRFQQSWEFSLQNDCFINFCLNTIKNHNQTYREFSSVGSSPFLSFDSVSIFSLFSLFSLLPSSCSLSSATVPVAPCCVSSSSTSILSDSC